MLPYSDRLKEKILIALSKALLEKNNKNMDIKHTYYHLVRFLSYDFDVIDLAGLLGITTAHQFIKSIDIDKYNQQHFASEYDVDNITQITQNNFTLYQNWRHRLTQNIQERQLHDFNVPELDTVYLYLKAAIESYQEVFGHSAFKDFLKAKTKAMRAKFSAPFFLDSDHQYQDLEPFIKGILQKAESFKNLNLHEEEVTPNSLSYLKFLEMDLLLTILIDSILLPSSKFSNALTYNYKAGYLRALDFMNENLFFIPHIGDAPEIAFLNSLATPLLHVFDLSVSLMPVENGLSDVEHRRNHDYNHSSLILQNYLSSNLSGDSTENLDDTKSLFLKSLLSLKKNFSNDDFKKLIQRLIHHHHECNYRNYPTDFNFIKFLLDNISKSVLTEDLKNIKGKAELDWHITISEFYKEKIEIIHSR